MTGHPHKKLSVITVTLNAKEDLAVTVDSVRGQRSREAIEFIVIDGCSSDGSVEWLESHRADIDTVYSGQDRGVYDAMNKGIALSTGEWLYFLNAGDVFLDQDALDRILAEMADADVLYSDVLVDNGRSTYTFKTSFADRVLNHQGFVYRKVLHERFGLYAVVKGFSPADYWFFLQLDGVSVKKLDTAIAIFKTGGLSSSIHAVQQKYSLDFLVGKTSAYTMAVKVLMYPGYRLLSKLFR